MTRHCEKLQLWLFEDDKPSVALTATQLIDLTTLVEALLREIATALTNGGISDDQDHD